MYCLGMDKGLLPFYTRYLIPMLSLTTKDGTPGHTCHFSAYSRQVEEKEGKGLDSDLTEQAALPQPSFLHLS